MRSTAVLLPAFACFSLLPAQAPANKPARKPAARTAAPQDATQLPITRVSLYKNGVGFFEHAGRVTGNQTVTIDFTTAQLNDVLQSLTAIDLNGGRIAGAGYNSTTPLEQQLKALPFSLGPDADSTAFYNAIRGARVEVHGPGVAITGRLLNLELRATQDKDGQATTENRWITVVADSGTVRTLQLTPTTEVRLLDAALHTDINRYLQLLADTRGNQGLRRLTLQDNGEGPRDLRVSYISEVPIWKSTYRILFTDPASPSATKQTATLQGWSVVDNTTGSDWLNVQLSLIAGAPQSFIQPLSVPYYSRRAEIPLPQEAQLAPQTHDSGDASLQSGPGIQGAITDQSGAVIPNAQITVINNATGARVSGTSGNDGTFAIAVPQAGQYRVEVNSPGFQRLIQQGVSVRSQTVPLNFVLNVGSSSQTVEVMAENNAIGGPMAMKARALPMSGRSFNSLAMAAPGIAYEDAAAQSITPQTTTAAFDDFFQYTLAQPITIRKNESALVPILQTKIDAERVTLWSPQQPQPLRALWITNTSNLTLDRGSFSIVEGGSFGGEGLLDPIHPKERRLLSYAADQAIRVSTDYSHNTHRVERVTVSKGVLRQSTVDISEVEYVVRNAAPEPRTVVVEHPVRQGWTIDSDPKPTETTPTTHRFRINVPPGETVRLHIGERHPGAQSIRLIDQNEDQLALTLRNANASPALLQQLEPVLAARHALTELDRQIAAKQAALDALVKDQERLRANLAALKGTAEERSLAKRYTGELNQQEDQLATLHKDLDTLNQQRQTATTDLGNKIKSLNID